MKVFLDFDGVLFDTKRFERAYLGALREFGVRLAEARRLYTLTKEKTGKNDPQTLARIVADSCRGVTSARITEALFGALDSAPKYVFPGTEKFLRTLSERADKVVIVSRGDPVFQNEKILKSGLSTLVDEIHIVSESDKGGWFRLHTRGEKGVLIFADDKASEIVAVKREVPRIYAIHVVQSGSPVSRSADATVSTALDILKALEH
jgi:phosphoserine phosphatase